MYYLVETIYTYLSIFTRKSCFALEMSVQSIVKSFVNALSNVFLSQSKVNPAEVRIRIGTEGGQGCTVHKIQFETI